MAAEITLGGRRFELRPLKLGQLRPLLDALDHMAGRSGGALIDAAAALLAAGLAPAQPDLTVDVLLDLEASLDELNRAVAAILRNAGLSPQETVPGEATPGETAPVAMPAPNSAPSMPLSPPAAATPTP